MISGSTLVFEQNALRLQAITFDFDNPNAPRLKLHLADKTYDVPVGMSGRPAFSSTGPFGLPFATQGKWDSKGHFVLDLDTVANINHYTIDIAVNAHNPTAKINEATGELKDYFVKARFQAGSHRTN